MKNLVLDTISYSEEGKYKQSNNKPNKIAKKSVG